MNRTHSTIGIISLILCIITVGMTIGLRFTSGKYPLQYVCLDVILSLLALFLGISGLFEKDHKRLFSILGTIISLPLLAFNGYLLFLMFITI